MSGGKVGRRYTYLGLLAGGGVGLVTGTLFFATPCGVRNRDALGDEINLVVAPRITAKNPGYDDAARIGTIRHDLIKGETERHVTHQYDLTENPYLQNLVDNGSMDTISQLCELRCIKRKYCSCIQGVGWRQFFGSWCCYFGYYAGHYGW